jgi:hypothetical protein
MTDSTDDVDWYDGDDDFEFAEGECSNCGKLLNEEDYDDLCFACYAYFHPDEDV